MRFRTASATASSLARIGLPGNGELKQRLGEDPFLDARQGLAVAQQFVDAGHVMTARREAKPKTRQTVRFRAGRFEPFENCGGIVKEFEVDQAVAAYVQNVFVVATRLDGLKHGVARFRRSAFSLMNPAQGQKPPDIQGVPGSERFEPVLGLRDFGVVESGLDDPQTSEVIFGSDRFRSFVDFQRKRTLSLKNPMRDPQNRGSMRLTEPMIGIGF